MPFEEMAEATLDHHRHLRVGFGEVVFCAGKTPRQVAEIFARLAESSPQVLGTRATAEQYEAACEKVSELKFHESAKAIWLDRQPQRPRLEGVVVAAAGTSDLPVADEAALTLDLMGHAPKRLTDVGVAGLHRLLHHREALDGANASDRTRAGGKVEPKATPYPMPGTYERDKWIYENIEQVDCCDTLSRKLKEQAKKRKWQIIGSRNGFKKAADRYANFHKLPIRRFAGD